MARRYWPLKRVIGPHFGTSMTPDSSVGVVAANTSVTLHVVLRRAVGTKNYSWTNTGSNLLVWAQPIAAP